MSTEKEVQPALTRQGPDPRFVWGAALLIVLCVVPFIYCLEKIETAFTDVTSQDNVEQSTLADNYSTPAEEEYPAAEHAEILENQPTDTFESSQLSSQRLNRCINFGDLVIILIGVILFYLFLRNRKATKNQIANLEKRIEKLEESVPVNEPENLTESVQSLTETNEASQSKKSRKKSPPEKPAEEPPQPAPDDAQT